ncbi:MAG: response regulator [Woeseiaceae bacterium]|nr:response regulator [Woeseiaceae bacterium]
MPEHPVTTEKIVLVVDDHKLVRSMIVSLLTREGFQVLDAETGELALEILEKRGAEIGCVLQDLSMPSMPGEDVVAAMLELAPGLPIIVMSADDEAYGRTRLGGMSIAAYVQKPFEPDELVGNVVAALPGE